MHALAPASASFELPAEAAQTHIQAFRFAATGGEYFRIWIVNLLLTIVTLGLYSAWAKVRRLRYFYGCTSLAGTAFEYHGDPLKILKGRLIAVTAFAAYALLTSVWPLMTLVLLPLLALAAPFVIVRSRRFHMRMSSWRNIRFGFCGTYKGAAVAYVGWGVAAVATLYMLIPLWLFKKAEYVIGETRYGEQRFAFVGRAGEFARFYFKALGFGVIAYFGVMLLLASSGIVVQTLNLPPLAGALLVFLCLMGLLGVILAAAAYYEKSLVNATYGNVTIGPHRVVSTLRVRPLLRLYVTNIIGVLFTLGLFYPWALVRRLRYQIESMSVSVVGSLDEFTAANAQDPSTIGEEVGEFFDLDFGV